MGNLFKSKFPGSQLDVRPQAFVKILQKKKWLKKTFIGNWSNTSCSLGGSSTAHEDVE